MISFLVFLKKCYTNALNQNYGSEDRAEIIKPNVNSVALSETQNSGCIDYVAIAANLSKTCIIL